MPRPRPIGLRLIRPQAIRPRPIRPRPIRAARGVLAVLVTIALTGTLMVLGQGSATAATTQTKSCTDGSGVRWTVIATWGRTYTKGGVRKVVLSSARWTTKSTVARTDSWVRTYDGRGRRLQALARSGAFDYRSGTVYAKRNPINPPTAAGRPTLRVTLGVDGDGKGNCRVTFRQPAGSASAKYEADVVRATNAERTSRDLAALRTQACVDRFAEAQAARMAREQRMFHQDLGPILDECQLRTVGENVAAGYASGQAVTAGWMGSAGHRRNILTVDYRLLGVGAAKGANGVWYAAQVFGG